MNRETWPDGCLGEELSRPRNTNAQVLRSQNGGSGAKRVGGDEFREELQARGQGLEGFHEDSW